MIKLLLAPRCSDKERRFVAEGCIYVRIDLMADGPVIFLRSAGGCYSCRSLEAIFVSLLLVVFERKFSRYVGKGRKKCSWSSLAKFCNARALLNGQVVWISREPE